MEYYDDLICIVRNTIYNNNSEITKQQRYIVSHRLLILKSRDKRSVLLIIGCKRNIILFHNNEFQSRPVQKH